MSRAVDAVALPSVHAVRREAFEPDLVDASCPLPVATGTVIKLVLAFLGPDAEYLGHDGMETVAIVKEGAPAQPAGRVHRTEVIANSEVELDLAISGGLELGKSGIPPIRLQEGEDTGGFAGGSILVGRGEREEFAAPAVLNPHIEIVYLVRLPVLGVGAAEEA